MSHGAQYWQPPYLQSYHVPDKNCTHQTMIRKSMAQTRSKDSDFAYILPAATQFVHEGPSQGLQVHNQCLLWGLKYLKMKLLQAIWGPGGMKRLEVLGRAAYLSHGRSFWVPGPIYIYIYTYMYVYVCVYIYIYIHMCTYVRTCVRTYVRTHPRTYIHMYVCMYVWMDGCMDVYMFIRVCSTMA